MSVISPLELYLSYSGSAPYEEIAQAFPMIFAGFLVGLFFWTIGYGVYCVIYLFRSSAK
jgi:hypothetical protein